LDWDGCIVLLPGFLDVFWVAVFWFDALFDGRELVGMTGGVGGEWSQ